MEEPRLLEGRIQGMLQMSLELYSSEVRNICLAGYVCQLRSRGDRRSPALLLRHLQDPKVEPVDHTAPALGPRLDEQAMPAR